MRKLIFGLLLIFMMMPLGAKAQSVQDCDSNAIIFCGVSSQSQFASMMTNGDGHNSAASIQAAYSGQGIDTQTLRTTSLKMGTVTKDGRVFVGGAVVATGAKSVGRQFIPGSTAGGAFWIRPTSVSFAHNSLDALVNMQGGAFKWAILTSCGNPVVATPVIVKASIQKVVVTKTAAPPPAPVVTPTPAALPQTGSEWPISLVGLFAVVSIGFSVYYYRRSQRDLLVALANRST